MAEIEEKFYELQMEIKAASRLAREYFQTDSTKNEQKADGSVVTDVDKGIERQLREWIELHFPADAVVGEEEVGKAGTSGFVWHIDPIDGTDNFMRKIPFCAVSVARLGDTPEDSFGIVYNPLTEQMFSSLMEDGMYENQRVTNLTAEPLGGKYVITVATTGREPWMRPAKFALFAGLSQKFGKSISYGSTALELAYVAANRIDGYLTFGLNSYDYAAGLFLVKAAGGAISVFEEGAWQRHDGSIKDICDTHNKTIFASHPDIHDTVLEFVGDPIAWSKT